MVRHCLYRIILLPLLYQELSHWSITMKNLEIQRLLSRYPIFKQSDQPIYSKRVIFSCKSYENFLFGHIITSKIS